MSAAVTDRDSEIAELITRHFEAVGSDCHKDCDCHWYITERWSYGEHTGWVVEHGGRCYDGLEHGEDGPFPTREEAEVVLIDHLLAAIAQIEAREG
ncbi:MAG TPA: hypothetical protein VFJ57_12050 [Solirubrobacterales bacterium]|nr:hypothetical protein [Solirubrobacterales bacterium]